MNTYQFLNKNIMIINDNNNKMFKGSTGMR